MESVLVVSSTEKGREFIRELLCASSCPQITLAQSGAEARRLVAQCDYDLVVINTPLSDEFGHELGLMLTETTAAGVLLLVKNEMADDVAARVESAGVFVVPKPLSRAFFYQALKLVTAARQRILGLKNENSKLQNKIEEIRLVDRAKCALIQYLNYTEAAAHRYIEKQAMDRRTTRREIAREILNTYGG